MTITTAPSPTVILASASTGRLAVLRAAGVEPVVRVSHANEDAIRAAHAGSDPAQVVAALASGKATAVIADAAVIAEFPDAIVVGADSMLLLDGVLQGKPHTADVARQRWAKQMGRAGDLLTGHCVIRVADGRITRTVTATTAARVHMGRPTAAELDAYLASGEPLEVAGAFTIDGLGGWFVERIEGDPSCVVGLSLPTVRRLLADVGIRVTDVWNRHGVKGARQ